MASSNLIFAIHGLGGHSGWFERLKDELVQYDIQLVAYDLPGFGKNHMMASDSPYTKGHVDSYKEWLDYIQDRYQALRDSNPGAKITILGHSLGAVIATNLYDIYSEDNLILSVPGYKGASNTFNPSFTFNVIWKLVFDKFLFKNDVYVEMPVSEKSKLTPAMQDPLRIGTVTQTLLYEILKLGDLSKEHILRLVNPCMMIQIDGDLVVDNPTQDKMFDLIPSANKTKKVYSGADHDWIWYDQVTTIAKDIADWL